MTIESYTMRQHAERGSAFVAHQQSWFIRVAIGPACQPFIPQSRDVIVCQVVINFILHSAAQRNYV